MRYDFKSKRITVVGLARSGMACISLLRDLGAEVYVTDSGDSVELRENEKCLRSAGVKVEIGAHSRDFVRGKDLLVISPGVPQDSVILKWAREDAVAVVGEIELGFLCCDAPIIAVTGTNGKSTTTSLIGEILTRAGMRVVVCGNIGNPFCGEVYKTKDAGAVVLETSSFQLESIEQFHPRAAILLNISQNHFDRHPDLNAYINAKARIFENQDKDDFTILNYDDPLTRNLSVKTRANVLFFSRREGTNAAYFKDGALIVSSAGRREAVCVGSDLKIKGPHNIENALAALCAASIFNIDPKAMKEALLAFKGLEHRFEYVTDIDGIEFINDSKATTVLAVAMALESCDKPVVLIAGGHDKGSDFTKVRAAVASKVKKLILIGEAREKIKAQLKGAADTLEADSMKEAVDKAYSNASSGDCVLLSPMCASFDMFKNFEERGRIFKETVLTLR